MKALKFTKETLGLSLILIISAILNFANISKEGYGNGYYAAGVKSMTMSLKNFFFVAFDPAGFVTIDKPPMGFWIQTLFAKIFGFSGWSILLPQALAGVVSVYLVYCLVKRAFGTAAGLISALCLAVTPVFVAASRNNTLDNLLVVTLLFACLALTIAAERGKAKYLYISLLLVGIGFNIKMLEAYMIGPAIYITYLLASNVAFKKKIGHLVIGTVILFAVSLSWAVIVDLVPAQNRPYVGSSTDNSVLELIIGHNGLERLGLSGKSNGGFGGGNNNQDGRQRDAQNDGQNQQMPQGIPNGRNSAGAPGGMQAGAPGGMQAGAPGGMQAGAPGGMPGGAPGGQNAGLQGTFGGQTPAGITRLFSKNILSDQIVWFLPLALLGFIAGAIKEKLRFKLDNKRKIALVLWFVWLVPEFIYFSFTKGLFHPYYLTMMAPPAAALAGIGIVSMWEFYKEGKLKAWFLPIAFVVEGITHSIMLSYFTSNLPTFVRSIILVALIVCFVASALLALLNILSFIKRKNNTELDNSNAINLKKALVGIGLLGILATPFIAASTAIFYNINNTIPCVGLELFSNSSRDGFGGGNSSNQNSKLIDFLKSNKTNEKYLLVVSSSQSAQNIIIQTGEAVMALGGFSGSDNIISLEEFKKLVANGEVRYVLAGGKGGGASSAIMNWVAENGTLVSESQYTNTSSNNKQNTANPNNNSTEDKQNNRNMNASEQLYDLGAVAQTLK